MKELDLSKWERKEHYKLFSGLSNPYFSLTFNLDVSAFLQNLKKTDSSFFESFLYCLLEVVNHIPDFKIREIEGKIYKISNLGCSFTVLEKSSNLFSFAFVDYSQDFKLFKQDLNQEIIEKRGKVSIADKPRTDLIYFTSIPWLHFTQITHPYHGTNDSIPRFAIGKYELREDKYLLPLNIQAHHGFLDGVHVGILEQKLQNLLNLFPGE